MPRFSHLEAWLSWMEGLHPSEIDLGLERVYRVAANLGLLNKPSACSHEFSGSLANAHGKVITVAGTNGKGSCVAVLSHCLLAQGYSVGAYSSPHFIHYNERVQINGEPVSDEALCTVFEDIDQARENISLTYFEFGTLAALLLFVRAKVDYILLEVGLGGRLDAVNIVDADIAVISSIAIDHEAWLGSDRDIIAQEKLGIARKGKPLIIAETDLTPSLAQVEIDAPILYGQKDYHYQVEQSDLWRYEYAGRDLTFPASDLPVNSVMAAITALALLNVFPEDNFWPTQWSELSLPGRFQRLSYQSKDIILDVAHNPAAAQRLADSLSLEKNQGCAYLAVMAVMADKDYPAMVSPLNGIVDKWYFGDLSDVDRALPAHKLAKLAQPCLCFDSIELAFKTALADLHKHDKIIVFGSFYTVAAVQKIIDEPLLGDDCGREA